MVFESIRFKQKLVKNNENDKKTNTLNVNKIWKHEEQNNSNTTHFCNFFLRTLKEFFKNRMFVCFIFGFRQVDALLYTIDITHYIVEWH